MGSAAFTLDSTSPCFICPYVSLDWICICFVRGFVSVLARTVICSFLVMYLPDFVTKVIFF